MTRMQAVKRAEKLLVELSMCNTNGKRVAILVEAFEQAERIAAGGVAKTVAGMFSVCAHGVYAIDCDHCWKKPRERNR